jgi:hypothetical protein
MVSEEEFDAAFKDHKFKSAYNWRKFVLDPKKPSNSTIKYDRGQASLALQKRHAALYVEKRQDFSPLPPNEQVSKEEAEQVISALRKELENIRRYDSINERLGSASFLK